MKAKKQTKYALLWNNGKTCVGEDWVIAKHYLKMKGMKLGIIRVNRHLVYSIKKKNSASWETKGIITDAFDENLNRRLAFSDYFKRFILPQQMQNGFKVVKL